MLSDVRDGLDIVPRFQFASVGAAAVLQSLATCGRRQQMLRLTLARRWIGQVR